IRFVPDSGKRLEFGSLRQMMLGAVEFAGKLYASLDDPDEMLTLNLTLGDADGWQLAAPGRNGFCHISEIAVELRRSAADLAAAPLRHAEKLLENVCERFNLSGRDFAAALNAVADVAGKGRR
ncbi:MAG: hypothetical protein PHI35_05830, partial [Victivallaceae bacterium]|nr:hypothetical protein [Victivallaceae bacterium]